jgi:hypothetical protein
VKPFDFDAFNKVLQASKNIDASARADIDLAIKAGKGETVVAPCAGQVWKSKSERGAFKLLLLVSTQDGLAPVVYDAGNFATIGGDLWGPKYENDYEYMGLLNPTTGCVDK